MGRRVGIVFCLVGVVLFQLGRWIVADLVTSRWLSAIGLPMAVLAGIYLICNKPREPGQPTIH